MKPSNPFLEHYARLSDDELLRIAGEVAFLTPDAAQCLYGELNRRGLQFQAGSGFVADRASSEPRDIAILWQKLRTLATAVGHLAIGTMAVPMTVGMFLYSLKPVLDSFTWHSKLTHMPLFAVLVIVAGIPYGFAVARRHAAFWKSRMAQFIWIVPALFLIRHVLSSTFGPHLAGVRGRWWPAALHVLQEDAALFFFAAASYSVGHFLGSKSRIAKAASLPGACL